MNVSVGGVIEIQTAITKDCHVVQSFIKIWSDFEINITSLLIVEECSFFLRLPHM